MIAKEARQALALQRFADANPQLLEEIRELDAREQAQQIEWAFEDAAQEQGLQPWELALQLIAESPEQLRAMRLETHREAPRRWAWSGKNTVSSTKSTLNKGSEFATGSCLTSYYGCTAPWAGCRS